MKLHCHFIRAEILQTLGKLNLFLIDFNAMLLLAGNCDLLGGYTIDDMLESGEI